MSRDFQLYLTDILVACEKVLRYTDDMDFQQFIADDRTAEAGKMILLDCSFFSTKNSLAGVTEQPNG